jgi:hypothetical protein
MTQERLLMGRRGHNHSLGIGPDNLPGSGEIQWRLSRFWL